MLRRYLRTLRTMAGCLGLTMVTSVAAAVVLGRIVLPLLRHLAQ